MGSISSLATAIDAVGGALSPLVLLSLGTISRGDERCLHTATNSSCNYIV